eukprot:scaffold58910_cov65-Phaeocystis_antarctica.AAC.3
MAVIIATPRHICKIRKAAYVSGVLGRVLSSAFLWSRFSLWPWRRVRVSWCAGGSRAAAGHCDTGGNAGRRGRPRNERYGVYSSLHFGSGQLQALGSGRPAEDQHGIVAGSL